MIMTDLTRRCRIDRLKAQSLPKGSRRLAGLFPPFHMIKVLKEIANRAPASRG